MIQAPPIELTPEQEEILLRDVEEQLSRALEYHQKVEEKLVKLKAAYDAKPEVEVKTFPWPGASNVVIPIVPITVDNIVARLMRSFFGAPDPIEATIKSKAVEFEEKDFRDWGKLFIAKSGARDQIRSVFHDETNDGTAFVKVTWEEKKRSVNAYSADGGQITHTEVIDYTGPVWNEIPRCDIVYPAGYDEWKKLPWQSHRLRLNWAELLKAKADKFYDNIDEDLKKKACKRESPVIRQRRQKQGDPNTDDIYEFFEIWGVFAIPQPAGEGEEEDAEPQYVEVILTYSFDDGRFHRKTYNPFFGRARHFVRIPFLHQPHQIDGLGAAEQVLPFQIEASTSHNQSIDAATAAIAGIVVRKSTCETLDGKEIRPGTELVTDDPGSDFAVYHLSMGNSNLPSVEQQAAFWAEKRSGVSAYSMGVESPVAGSRATATGTTALISEGNQRFWVSIDDMRDAIVDLIYLTLQLEQQYRPNGTPIAQDRMLVLPQGDLREMIGLTISLSSEKVNRDIEIQNLQILIQILNDYYMKLMQAGGLVMNPAFPPQQKMIVLSVMEASAKMIKRIVERFDIENIDEIVPSLSQAIAMLGGQVGPTPMAGVPGSGAAGGSGVPALGPGGGTGGAVPSGQPGPASPFTR